MGRAISRHNTVIYTYTDRRLKQEGFKEFVKQWRDNFKIRKTRIQIGKQFESTEEHFKKQNRRILGVLENQKIILSKFFKNYMS